MIDALNNSFATCNLCRVSVSCGLYVNSYKLTKLRVHAMSGYGNWVGDCAWSSGHTHEEKLYFTMLLNGHLVFCSFILFLGLHSSFLLELLLLWASYIFPLFKMRSPSERFNDFCQLFSALYQLHCASVLLYKLSCSSVVYQ